MCIFGISPQRAVSHLAQMEYRLSRSQVAELLTVMERGYCSLPYELLLMSDNYNLQLLGIHLVRRFGITESRAEIVAIVRNEKSELRQDALETLVYFGDDCCCKYNIIEWYDLDCGGGSVLCCDGGCGGFYDEGVSYILPSATYGVIYSLQGRCCGRGGDIASLSDASERGDGGWSAG